jgi:molybdenum cofactor biosynthesis protein B
MVRVAILTISDAGARGERADTSGDRIVDWVKARGFELAGRKLVPDETVEIVRAPLEWADGGGCDVILTTGGTGLTGRDVTPEAVRPLFDKEIEGFQTVWHMVSHESVGLSTLQSRACAGLVGGTFIFCLPGSNGACKDGWDKIIRWQLDNRQLPCNMVELMPRLLER